MDLCKSFYIFAVLLASAIAIQTSSPYLNRAIVQADRLVQCSYNSNTGLFSELLWQSANTIESLSNLMIEANSNQFVSVIQNTYDKTGPIIDNCFDDHQWWLLAWIRAYQLTKDVKYLQRAAIIFDNTTARAWTTTQCGGGVVWCPVPPGTNGYKNAITNELYLTSAISLHPYANILGRSTNYYLDWAIKEWKWFSSTGMINSAQLINDGLNNQCTNNGGVTWTYNQGVLLNGLTLLSRAINDPSLLTVAAKIIQATFSKLTTRDGILNEPCSGCDGDQLIFKGIFLRHLGYAAANLTAYLPNLSTFLINNSNSVIQNAVCRDGSYGFLWQGPCADQSTAAQSSVLDLFTSAGVNAKNQPTNWRAIGLGNCVDDKGQSMPNCFRSGVSEESCRNVAQNDAKAVGYDISTYCNGQTYCRVRTLGGPSACPSGWSYGGGSATTVSSADGNHLTVCVLK